MRTRPIIIAHRGFSGRYPENTLRAFKEALRLRVDAIETDVRSTKDGALVIIHDDTVDRTTDGSGYVKDLTLDEISKLDAGSWKGEEFAGEHIPTLAKTLELVEGEVMLLVEIKEPDTTHAIIETLRRHMAFGWVNIVSFHSKAIKLAKQNEPEISCALIGGKEIGSSDGIFFDFVYDTLNCGANSVMVHYAALTPKRIRYCHERFLSVGTWTVDDRKLAQNLIAMGVDAIASNYPDVMLEAMAA